MTIGISTIDNGKKPRMSEMTDQECKSEHSLKSMSKEEVGRIYNSVCQGRVCDPNYYKEVPKPWLIFDIMVERFPNGYHARLRRFEAKKEAAK